MKAIFVVFIYLATSSAICYSTLVGYIEQKLKFFTILILIWRKCYEIFSFKSVYLVAPLAMSMDATVGGIFHEIVTSYPQITLAFFINNIITCHEVRFSL